MAAHVDGEDLIPSLSQVLGNSSDVRLARVVAMAEEDDTLTFVIGRWVPI